MWPDWAIFCTLGNFFKPLATISLAKSLTFLGNFCKGVKISFFQWNIFWATFTDIWRFFLVTLQIKVSDYLFSMSHLKGKLNNDNIKKTRRMFKTGVSFFERCKNAKQAVICSQHDVACLICCCYSCCCRRWRFFRK